MQKLKYFSVSVMPGSGVKAVVAGSYNDLPEHVKTELTENQFINRWENKHDIPVTSVKSAIGSNFVAIITGEENYQDYRQKYGPSKIH